MNKRNLTAVLLTCASAMLLSACQPADTTSDSPPLAGARLGGEFSLTDQNGRTVTNRDFDGKYRIVYFGYTFCPDVCPVDLNWLMLGLRRFESAHPDLAAKVQPIFVTVDPERDTPQVIGNYVRQFHPRLIGLTGTQQAIDAMARSYAVFHERRPGSTPESYLVAHSQIAYLMGPRGEPIAMLPIDNITTEGVNEGDPVKVARDLAKWVH